MNLRNEGEKEKNYPVKEYPGWLQQEWLMQRIGTALLFIIVIAGAGGIFSKGFLSDRIISSRDGSVTVEYERFGRILSSTDMKIRIKGTTSDSFMVTIGRGGVDKLQIQSLHPQPLRAETRDNDLILTFSATERSPWHTIWIGMEPKGSGENTISIQADNHLPVEFNQFIYP